MRAISISIVTIALLTADVLASAARRPAPTPGGRGQESVTRQILRLEDSWAAGVVRRDSALFERMLAPGFVYSEDDRTMTRAVVLEDILTSTDTVREAHNEGMEVHRFGAATAVVTGWLVLRGRGPGGPFDRHYRFTDTWVRGNRGWQIVAAHDYLAPAKR